MEKLPTMFIGSSSEGKEVAEYWQAALEQHCDSDVWDQHIFQPGNETLNGLLDASRRYDFATLVLSPDDLTDKRGTSSYSPRDNVIFELGMFLSTLGRERVFILKKTGQSLHLPSDLLGSNLLQYSDRKTVNLRAQLNPPALKARESMEKLGRRVMGTNLATIDPDPLRFASDLTAGLSNGAAGIRVSVADPDAQLHWRGNLLAVLAEQFMTRCSDAYAIWLRPKGPDSPLEPFLYRNLPDNYEHYSFHRDEGLAGRVWSRGIAAAHSASAPHPWWMFREGCENTTYLCAPVGDAGRSGGVLAVGSDSGFAVEKTDATFVQLLASLLASSLDDTRADERRILRDRLAHLNATLEPYTASRPAHRREVKIHDLIVAAAQTLLIADPFIAALETLEGDLESGSVTCGTLRMNLAQIGAVL